MNHSLRLATIDDLDMVEEIVRSAYSHYVIRIGREPGPMLDDYAMLIGEARVHVLEHDRSIRGILVLLPRDDAMLLDNVAVSPTAQGKGFGRILLEFAERVAVDSGCEFIKLYTNEVMTENLELYARLGYHETHRAEERGLRRVYMSKAISRRRD
jgi:GNAT superfamily N-acetyltransferase